MKKVLVWVCMLKYRATFLIKNTYHIYNQYIITMKQQKLELEFRDDYHGHTHSFKSGGLTVMMTPMIDEDYWVFRVKLHEDQAIVAFPKFGTMGIGFAIEEDWNTNLPYQCTTKKICQHIWENRKYNEITEEMCLKAIEMLQKASKYYMEKEKPTQENFGSPDDAKMYMDRMFKFVRSRKPYEPTIPERFDNIP